jgi:hypothetical protein
MSYLDFLTDDNFEKILNIRCDNIEKEIKKIENNLNDINEYFDIWETDSEEAYEDYLYYACNFCENTVCRGNCPPYRCDHGCGREVGCGMNNDCVRVCNECYIDMEQFL